MKPIKAADLGIPERVIVLARLVWHSPWGPRRWRYEIERLMFSDEPNDMPTSTGLVVWGSEERK